MLLNSYHVSDVSFPGACDGVVRQTAHMSLKASSNGQADAGQALLPTWRLTGLGDHV